MSQDLGSILGGLAAQQAGAGNAYPTAKQQSLMSQALDDMTAVTANLHVHLARLDAAIRRLSQDVPPPQAQGIGKEKIADSTAVNRLHILISKVRESCDYAQTLADTLDKIV